MNNDDNDDDDDDDGFEVINISNSRFFKMYSLNFLCQRKGVYSGNEDDEKEENKIAKKE